MDRWTPATEGVGFEFTPILKPLEPFRDTLNVITNLTRPEKGVDTNHAGAPASWLAGVPPKRTAGPDYELGITLDQVVAKRIGQETTFPSIELATEDFTGLVGDCAPGIQLRVHEHPELAVGDRAAANGNQPAARVRAAVRRRRHSRRPPRAHEDGSEPVGLRRRRSPGCAGPASARGDRVRLDQYLDHVREIERRIQHAEQQAESLLAVPNAPVGVPESFEEHVTLLFDLLAVAYQADLTRVFTFMLGRELSQRTYPHIGVTEPHHSISHHGNRPPAIEGHAKVNTYHLMLFAKFIERLRSTPDGDGSLLDHSLILYGSGMGNGNVHSADLLPTLLVGGAAGSVKGGRHIVAGTLTPNADLLISMAERFDIGLERFGGNTGRISLS